MGNTASDVGTAVGNAILAPIKAIFGHSCQNICSGIWDVECFIEHLCVPDLFKLLLVCALCYVCLVFVYLVLKLGICQCVVKTLCKASWAACETYCYTLDYICCFCWHKIRHTKRVYRTRHHHRHHGRSISSSRDSDVELGGYFTNSASSSNRSHTCSLPCNRTSGRVADDDDVERSHSRKRKSRHWEGDQRRWRGNGSKNVRVKTRKIVSFQVKGRSRHGRSNRAIRHSQRLSFGRSGKRSTRSVKLKKPKIG